MPVKRCSASASIFHGLWACMPVSLAIQENAQDAVVELSGHGMVIHGKQQSRNL